MNALPLAVALGLVLGVLLGRLLGTVTDWPVPAVVDELPPVDGADTTALRQALAEMVRRGVELVPVVAVLDALGRWSR